MPGLRGGLANAIFHPTDSADNDGLEAKIRVLLNTPLGEADYDVAFDRSGGITRENLRHSGREIFFYDGRDAFFRVAEKQLIPCFPNPYVGSQVLLAYQTGLAGPHKAFVEAWRQALLSMQFLEPS